MRFILAMFILFFANNLYAADPCIVLDIGQLNNDGLCHATKVPFINRHVNQDELLAEIVILQRRQIDEMKTAIVNLAAAVNSLAIVSQELKKNNENWQANTLEKTIAEIDNMPEKLASLPILQKIIKEQLSNDKDFIKMIKNSN